MCCCERSFIFNKDNNDIVMCKRNHSVSFLKHMQQNSNGGLNYNGRYWQKI